MATKKTSKRVAKKKKVTSNVHLEIAKALNSDLSSDDAWDAMQKFSAGDLSLFIENCKSDIMLATIVLGNKLSGNGKRKG